MQKHRQQRAQLGGDALGAHHNPSSSIENLTVGSRIRRHAGGSACHRFQQSQGQPLDKTGKDEHLGALHQRDSRGLVGFIAPPEDGRLVVLVHQTTSQRAISDDHEATVLGVHHAPGLKKRFHVLFGGEPTHVEENPFGADATVHLLQHRGGASSHRW